SAQWELVVPKDAPPRPAKPTNDNGQRPGWLLPCGGSPPACGPHRPGRWPRPESPAPASDPSSGRPHAAGRIGPASGAPGSDGGWAGPPAEPGRWRRPPGGAAPPGGAGHSSKPLPALPGDPGPTSPG